MKHARSDYDRIQDPGYADASGVKHQIPDDEPVFLIRAQDITAPRAVSFWAILARDSGAIPDIVNAAIEQGSKMLRWQVDHKAKIPDMPAGAGVDDGPKV
jgi:hypothetical protein